MSYTGMPSARSIDITFPPSRSAKYDKAADLAIRLPGYGLSCHIEGGLEILKHYQDVEELAEIVLSWRSGSVLLDGKPCRSLAAFRSAFSVYGAAGSQRIGNHTWDYEGGLPLPFVHYPRSHGTFIGFAEEPGGPVYLCSCAERAVENYLALNRGKDPAKDFPLGVDPAAISYRKCVCHRCNGIKPKLLWCDPMYKSKADRTYGWYQKQAYYSHALHPSMAGSTEEDMEKAAALETRMREEVREAFGFRSGSKGEYAIYKKVAGEYPGEDIIRHYHPSWLDGLELDIYLPGRKLAFEYNGSQHYKAVGHWGGEAQLAIQQEHDKRKAELCREHGVTLKIIDGRSGRCT